MRLGSSTDKKDSGRLHVDFAQARDDFYEWECKQRMRAREERHRRKLEEDRLRPPSPPAIMHYSEHEAALLADKLKGRRPPSRACPPVAPARWHTSPAVPKHPRCPCPFHLLIFCRRGHLEAWDRALPAPACVPRAGVRTVTPHESRMEGRRVACRSPRAGSCLPACDDWARLVPPSRGRAGPGVPRAPRVDTYLDKAPFAHTGIRTGVCGG